MCVAGGPVPIVTTAKEGRQDARKFATKEKKNKFAKTASPTAPDVSLYHHLLSSFKLL